MAFGYRIDRRNEVTSATKPADSASHSCQWATVYRFPWGSTWSGASFDDAA